MRPIALGKTVRRLPAKCASKMVYHNLAEYVSPLQMGAGMLNGAKAAAYAARSFLSAAKDDDVFIKLDFENAFNTLRIDAIADSILQLAPELYPFFLICYRAHSSLVYGDYVNDSQEGFQQGDPIASVGFCMVIQPALTSMQSQFEVGYLDDISAGDNWKIVLRDRRTCPSTWIEFELHKMWINQNRFQQRVFCESSRKRALESLWLMPKISACLEPL